MNCRFSEAVLPVPKRFTPVSVPSDQLLCLPEPLIPFEGFLVQQHAELVAAGDLVHNGHQQLVVVVGQIGLLVHGSQFELIGRHLVMTRLYGNAQPSGIRTRGPS